MEPKLPVHGFVLAGGRSTRMGEDKALMHFCGRPMIEIAVEKLRGFCAEVGIAGNRDDLVRYARVAREDRTDAGPAAGVEAGLAASAQPWVMFVPVDVPLVPMRLLHEWFLAVEKKLESGCRASYLVVEEQRQPAFCVMRRECLRSVEAVLQRGERRLSQILAGIGESEAGWVWACDVATVADAAIEEIDRWFWNVNTPQELAEAEAWASVGTLHAREHPKRNHHE